MEPHENSCEACLYVKKLQTPLPCDVRTRIMKLNPCDPNECLFAVRVALKELSQYFRNHLKNPNHEDNIADDYYVDYLFSKDLRLLTFMYKCATRIYEQQNCRKQDQFVTYNDFVLALMSVAFTNNVTHRELKYFKKFYLKEYFKTYQYPNENLLYPTANETRYMCLKWLLAIRYFIEDDDRFFLHQTVYRYWPRPAE